jgi:hypothetical protein
VGNVQEVQLFCCRITTHASARFINVTHLIAMPADGHQSISTLARQVRHGVIHEMDRVDRASTAKTGIPLAKDFRHGFLVVRRFGVVLKRRIAQGLEYAIAVANAHDGGRRHCVCVVRHTVDPFPG